MMCLLVAFLILVNLKIKILISISTPFTETLISISIL